MKTHLRIARAFVGFASLALTVSACATTVTGTASPAPVTSSSSPSADVFANLNACRLIDQLNAGQGFNPGENKSARNQCVAVKPSFGSYALAWDSAQGLSDFARTNNGVVNISINGRAAMQADTGLGGCAVAIGVSEHARALVIATLPNVADQAQLCSSARAFAERVEPLLPKVQ
ncbi:DUF3558 domain-containing protein [Amycolatopsis thermophila]|uniref:DUF3558 domain-containing protein n=1 Tax=Amycolatopsis thermophila TaxID=206084 RepID=A0ABU0ESY9_9PSEU|nr:DUF3558 domain-containing protein [Amycolatopsis thermophila]MDQ0378081.1 hypothetical protein [Amycolatopsis thermophila]